MAQRTVAIIGGGASGLAAAVAAGERARRADAELEIVIYERDDRVGRSILATGNGRCNFSNENLRLDEYRNGAFVEDALRGLSCSYSATEGERYLKIRRDNGDDVHAFFYRQGLMWRTEEDGREYPHTNKASTVLDVLRAGADRLGVQERCGSAVKAVEAPREPGGRFCLRMAGGVIERADAVVIACGGCGIPELSAAGLEASEIRPVLGPLRVADADIPFVRELDNIRVRCRLSLSRATDTGASLDVASEFGEAMFRKYGVSGIAAFNLSRMAEPGDTLVLNLLNAATAADAEERLFIRRKLLGSTIGAELTYGDMLRGMVLPRIAEALLKRAGRRLDTPFAKADVAQLARLLCNVRLEVAGIGDESICQVRRGGLPVAAFDARTMGVRGISGLFAAGEALDVDGPCGGYNLHWAWASGLLAGRSAAEALLGSD